jgi:hypothetical protein
MFPTDRWIPYQLLIIFSVCIALNEQREPAKYRSYRSTVSVDPPSITTSCKNTPLANCTSAMKNASVFTSEVGNDRL